MWVTMHDGPPVMTVNTKLARLRINVQPRGKRWPRGCYDEGRAHARQAIDAFRQEQAGVLTRLGDAHRALGDRPAAREAWRHALAVLDDLHHPDAAQVVSRLDDLRVAL
jgi:hypothetical protein